MKAERRHELKENTLVRKLEDIPGFSKTYGTRLMLGVIVLALIVVLIRYRLNSAAESLAQSQASLTQAREDLKQLKELTYAPAAQAAPIAMRRQDMYDDGLQQLDIVLKKAPDKQTQLRAQAMIYQGDFNWELANMPDLPGAATQPSLRPNATNADLLNNAEASYSAVIAQYPNEILQATAARFGLAAIAENRGAANRAADHTQWEKARANYQAVVDSSAPQVFKQTAQARINNLTQLEQPILIDVLAPATTLPSTLPSLDMPILGPVPPMPTTSMPSTRPAK